MSKTTDKTPPRPKLNNIEMMLAAQRSALAKSVQVSKKPKTKK